MGAEVTALPLFDQAKRAPAFTRQDVDILIRALAGHGWMTAKQLKAVNGFNDRELRQLAHVSKGEIISGQFGYKLTAEATPGELDHAEKWLRSQAQSMVQRAYEIRQARNRSRSEVAA